MKTAISIPDDLFDAAERLATRIGISRSELYQRAVAAYVKDHDHRVVTEVLNEVYDLADSGLDPVVEWMQRWSIPEEDW